MGEPTAREVGADLAELYHKGAVVLPGVADALAVARSKYGAADTSTSFTRSTSDFYQNPAFFIEGTGFPGAGPGPDFAGAISGLCGHISGLEHTLRLCGTNIIKTAQDLAETDGDVRGYYVKLGGKL